MQNNKVSFKGNTFKHVGNKIETSFEGEFLNTETGTGNESERKVNSLLRNTSQTIHSESRTATWKAHLPGWCLPIILVVHNYSRNSNLCHFW